MTPLSVEFGGELDITVKYRNKEPVTHCNMYYHTYQFYTNQSFLEFRSIDGESLKIYLELMSPGDGEGVYDYVHDIDEILFEPSVSHVMIKNALSNDDV